MQWWAGGGGIKVVELHKLNRLVKKASAVVGLQLDSVEVVAARRMKDKINKILDNPSHPLDEELWQRASTFSQRLIPPRSRTEQFRCSFVPAAIRLHDSA